VQLPCATRLLLGFSGPRVEAEEIKSKLGAFLRDHLKLELSKEKTLITHARTKAARFLGYEIVTLNANDKHDQRGQRCINGAPGLKVPVEVIKEKCSRYMQQGKPIHRVELVADTDFSISTQYQAEYRGLVQYDLLAFNVHSLWRLHRVMEISLVMTLANKFKTKTSQIYQKYHRRDVTNHSTLKVLEVTVDRGTSKKPLVARFGGIELRWQKHATLEDQPKRVYSSLRSEVVQRLLAQECELCETEEGPFQVHHVRKLADLDRPGQGEKSPWVKRMASRHRKTLVVCQRCHEAIHRERPQHRKNRG
jgi:Type II intron maturase